MRRVKGRMVVSAAVLAAAAGTCSASLNVTPLDVITWGGVGGQGRSLAGVAPVGLTWAWNNSGASNPVIDGNGRVYFQGTYTQTPPLGTIAANSHRAVFTATNSVDLSVFDGKHDGGTYSGYNIRNAASSAGGISTTTPRISGTRVAFGLQVSGGTPPVVETGAGANNTMFLVGNSAGVATAAQQLDPVMLNDINGVPVSAGLNNNLRTISQQQSQINSSGTALMWMSTAAAAGSFVTTANAASAPFGNNAFLATKTVGGGYNVIAQGGQSAPGVPGGRFQNGNNGINGFFARINRNGDVAFDGRLCTNFPVTTSSDQVAYIAPSGGAPVLVYREGQPIRDAAGNPDAGGAIFGNATVNSGGITTALKSFSTAGLMFTATSIGGDTVTSGPGQNDSGLYLATTSSTVRVIRRNDPIPGAPAGVNLGVINAGGSAMGINNNGFMAFGATLQGSGVIPHVQPQTTFALPPNPRFVTATGTQGDDTALIAGFNGALQMLARTGDLVPGTDGLRFDVDIAQAQITMNNSNELLFRTGTTLYAPGDTIGVVGQTTAESILPAGPNIWMGWSQAYGLVPLLTQGQIVEVDAGVFKTVQNITPTSSDNGDGGASGLNDAGSFVVNASFTDGTWGVIKLQIPAPGSGVMGLLGLGVMARRRRH